MVSNRRRSDRLRLTIPLRIHGEDPKGARFNEEGRTVTINRHGAAIQTAHPLAGVSRVRITNEISHHEAEFRVVGLVGPMSPQGAEWGMECLDPKENIWGIQFPPLDPAQDSESKALVECRQCHTVALMALSLVEVEVLETSGIIAKPCSVCSANSSWGYAESRVGMDAPPLPREMLADGGAVTTEAGRDSRRHRRVSLQLPVQIRSYYGEVERTKSENVSKGGFCFASEKDYMLGQGILAVCPYNAAGPNIEVQARIVRRRAMEGSARKVYGVRYISQPL